MLNISQEPPEQLLAQAMGHHQAGRWAQAEALYRQILGRWPGFAEAWHLLGVLAAQTGHLAAGAEMMEKAIALAPNNVTCRSNLGETYRKMGHVEKAEAHLRQGIAGRSPLADIYNNYAVLLLEQKRPREAEDLLRTAPRRADLWRLLADSVVAQDRREEALPLFDEALRLDPGLIEARFNRGSALALLGRPAEAIEELQKVLQAKPNDRDALILMGHCLAQAGKTQEAYKMYLQVIALDPNNAEVYGALGNVYRTSDLLDNAIAAYTRSLELRPHDVSTLGNLSFALRDQARLAEGEALLRRALEHHPEHAGALSALILLLHLDPASSPEQIDAEKENWNRLHVDPVAAKRLPHANARTTGRRLRIGYVSADLRMHPVGRFMEPLLRHHDRTRVEVFCYASALNPDDFTTQIRAASDHWRNIASSTDDQAAALIRADQIDILIDLCNHTASNRLTLFAHKPAPVQITYLAYGAGTGLRTMDWRLTDPFIDPPPPPLPLPPPKAPHPYGEKPLRLAETFWCYAPQPFAGDVQPLPADRNGYLTFGSLNFFSKINDQVLTLWTQLLQALPSARLAIHVPAGSRQDHVRSYFQTRGIPADRVDLIPRVSPEAYFKLYGTLDIALDPFPWAGGTTSCDALWMGVPVLTLADTRPDETLSRGGASLLSNLGLIDWITRTPDAYIQRALAAAADLPALRALRATLRPRMRASPLMDAARFARHVEDAYDQAWAAWCSEGK